MTQEKTHWKKNNDSRYISGDDLQAQFHGLKPEMIVQIDRFEDAETFDQQKNSKIIKTGLFLKEVGGQLLYKPVILNKTNAKFFAKECNSDFMEDWIGHPVILHAVKDSRHGYVVRFKKYVLPVLQKDSENFAKCYDAIHKGGFTIDKIRQKYQVSAEVEKLLMEKPTNPAA